jgi:glycosyltransferase involved in cell wall biosynthesis
MTRFVALNINQVEKGRDLLLSEFQSLHEDMKNVELHLFGDSEDRQLPGVVCHGSYKIREMDAILSRMDVGIIPSIWPESYAYVGPEMLTRGVPLIVSTAGAMQEYIIPNVNGLLFDLKVPGQLKTAMRSVANDPELLKRLKINAAIRTQGIVRFDDHVNEMEAIYAEVVGSPRA